MEQKKEENAGSRVMPGAQQELDYFIQIPEFRERFQKGNAVVIPRRDQEADGRGSTGKLFSETLNTSSTIPRCLVMFDDTSATSQQQSCEGYWLPTSTCSVFYELGTGVCGFDNICHGGIQTTLLDDVMGVLGVLNARLQDGLIATSVPGAYLPCRVGNQGMLDLTRSLFATQGLEVKFLRPLRTPQIIEVTAQLEEIDAEGGFYRVVGIIKDMRGTQYATARTKWILYPRRSSRL